MAPKKGPSSKINASRKTPPGARDDDHIVFEDDKKKKKGKAPTVAHDGPSDPTKPTARQVIGGQSWTGKLPVNLLSEYCQKQKWNKPDYSMRQLPGKEGSEKMYRSDVKLSKTDPKTQETITLPPMHLPPSEIHLADQPSALEARHFAATYTLFRIQSMKNIQMALPPKFRDLWKGDFSRLKKQDVLEKHEWKYDEDPFAAEAKRQEILKGMDKRKEDEAKRQQIQADSKGKNANIIVPIPRSSDDRGWETAPQAAMGQQIRLDTEEVIRQHAVWNQYGLSLSTEQRQQILTHVVKLGFRKSHIEEAMQYCADEDEVLEWLLVHVPEDDLPRWTFPSSYNAGISLASNDLEKEAKIKRLSSAGYPLEICAQMLRKYENDEDLAAFSLQNFLAPPDTLPRDTMQKSESYWNEEIETLGAIFGENMQIGTPSQCSVLMSTITGQAFSIQFRCPKHGYPDTTVPAIAINIEDTPAYVRLSATKRAVQYARSALLGEIMIYSICQWLETELPNIINEPGSLAELRLYQVDRATSNVDTQLPEARLSKVGNRVLGRTNRVDKRPGSEVLRIWQERQLLPEQIKMAKARERLPAWAKREEIVQAINDHQITIISGETGSGKSTQVVQFVLDNAIQNRNASRTNILCTQPRRVATLSLADRVSAERCLKVGDEVGYIIRGESKVSEKTKITFMTTGVLLRRLQSAPTMKAALANISHVFIDEVHERSLDTDFLLALLRECIESQPNLKIILMSATLDADIFSRYFGGASKVTLVHIEGRTFPVQDLYLEDALSCLEPGITEENIGKFIQTMGSGIKYDLIRDIIEYIDQDLGQQSGSILVFLPGTMEIERCIRALTSNPRIYALPLHASLLPVEQRKVFSSAPKTMRKVVVATNVAETSITIEDVVAVIDTGKVKETSYDAANNIVRLEEVWASHAACKQRRGRAGRVRAGVCYKLFTRTVEARMASKTLPEIQRVPLEQLCLSVKATDPDRNVAEFLSKTLTPPDSGAVSSAVNTLHVMNALENDKLTALGIYLAMIPADLRCAKLLIYGALFDCLEACLTIASILTVRSPFVSPAAKREEANEARMTFPSSDGDLMLDMAAYDDWSEKSSTLHNRAALDWCNSQFISPQTMRDIASTRRQLLDSLKDAGLVEMGYHSSGHDNVGRHNAQRAALLSALVAGSLQPQLALISFPSKKYIASMTGAKELDPEARTIKFLIPDESSRPISRVETPTSSRPGTPKPPRPDLANYGQSTKEGIPILSRVFIHPASCLFSAQTFPRHSTHLAYFTKMVTSKPFIRDLTPFNIYSLLFFGGKLELDTAGRGLTVGGVWKVKGWARIGVLVSRLRVLLDEELRRNIEDGGVLMGAMDKSKIVQLVKRLLVLNGQDQ